MLPLKLLVVLYALALLVLGTSAAWGDMPAALKGVEGAKAEGPRKAQEGKKTPVQVSPVRRATELVKKIEGGVLHTEAGNYNLTGVKVIDFTNHRQAPRVGKMPQKTAEMTFVNGQLREVVIRQRQ